MEEVLDEIDTDDEAPLDATTQASSDISTQALSDTPIQAPPDADAQANRMSGVYTYYYIHVFHAEFILLSESAKESKNKPKQPCGRRAPPSSKKVPPPKKSRKMAQAKKEKSKSMCVCD